MVPGPQQYAKNMPFGFLLFRYFEGRSTSLKKEVWTLSSADPARGLSELRFPKTLDNKAGDSALAAELHVRLQARFAVRISVHGSLSTYSGLPCRIFD